MIRPMSKDDVQQFFRMRADGTESREETAIRRQSLEEVFPRLFFEHPWFDGSLPSLVSEGSDGRINGTIGVLNRPMEFHGTEIAMGVCSDLYVSTQSRSSLAGLQLLKTFLEGPQDLSLTDVANATTRKIWERLGGIAAPLYGLNWIRVLHPGQFALSVLKRKRWAKVLAAAATPLAKTIDCLAGRVGLTDRLSCPKNIAASALTPSLFAEHFDGFAERYPLRPVYDARSAGWIWNRLDFVVREAGRSRQRLVQDASGKVLGWYIYQVNRGGIARVAQIVAFDQTIDTVLTHLFHDAFEQGSVALTGRLQPRFLQAFIDQKCLFRRRDAFTLVHSRDPEVMQTFASGQAFLTLLEGEAFLDIWNEPANASAALCSQPLTAAVAERELEFVG